MKKLLFIMTSLKGGGAEKVLIDLLHHFDYSRFEVDLCLLLDEGVYLPEIPAQVRCFKLYKSGKRRFLWEQRIRKYLGWHWGQKNRIRKYAALHYDTVISFMEGLPLVFHQYLLDRSDRNVTWVHTDLATNHYTSRLFLRLETEYQEYLPMDHIVFVSEKSKTQFGKLTAMIPTCSVIYNPIPREDIVRQAAENRPEKRKFTICSVGRLDRAKAFHRLIDVAESLKNQGYDLDFWIIGEGILRDELENAIRERHLEDSVFLLGFKKPPYPYVQQADIFLSTSLAEGYPLVICEALCLGLPVISTKTSGPTEILGNSEFGLLTEQSESSIEEALKSLIDDEQKRNFYHLKALERAGHLFDIDRSIRSIENVL